MKTSGSLFGAKDGRIGTVSYTHLDVYKRQILNSVYALGRKKKSIGAFLRKKEEK